MNSLISNTSVLCPLGSSARGPDWGPIESPGCGGGLAAPQEKGAAVLGKQNRRRPNTVQDTDNAMCVLGRSPQKSCEDCQPLAEGTRSNNRSLQFGCGEEGNAFSGAVLERGQETFFSEKESVCQARGELAYEDRRPWSWSSCK